MTVVHGHAFMESITRQDWGVTDEGQPVSLYTLRNANGVEATITDYGARLVALLVPDGNGGQVDIVLGYDSIDGYLGENPLFGSLMGRTAGRITGAKFALDGVEYRLSANESGSSLHGGAQGFDRRMWSARPVETGSGPALELSRLSTDGEEGYPGNLQTVVTYTLTQNNELRLDFEAATDRPTIVNLSNHSYFNLAGEGSGDVLGCELTINADLFAPTNAEQLATGELAPVDGTPFDFRHPRRIGDRMHEPNEQLRIGQGYDVTYPINRPNGGAELTFAARLVEPVSGRILDVYTTQPALQLYISCKLDGSNLGKGGKAYRQYGAVCLETEHLPDSPNHPNFPSIALRPGEVYKHMVVYKVIV